MYLGDGGPAVGGVVGGVEGVEAAGEDVVVAVGEAEDGVDLLHPEALVEVVQMGAVQVHLPGSRHLNGGSHHVPAPLNALLICLLLSYLLCSLFLIINLSRILTIPNSGLIIHIRCYSLQLFMF